MGLLSRFDLLGYQNRAVEFIKDHPQCLLWLPMGLGKTVITLSAYADLREAFEVRRVLVIGPKRVARKVWSDELKRWSHLNGFTFAKAIGTELERECGLLAGADVTAINRDVVPWLEEFYIQGKKQIRPWPFDMLVIDESQSFKSSDGVRFRSMRRIRKLAKRVVSLTGTFIPNGYMDAWAQIRLLDGGKRLGGGIGDFRKRWFSPVQQDGYSKWILNESAEKEIQQKIADIVLAMRAEDYLDLPPVVNNFIRVTLPPAAQRYYEMMEKDSIVELFNGQVITGVNAGATTGKLLQMANGAVYDSDHRWHHVHDKKIEALIETLEGLPEKCMIAYAYQHDVARCLKAIGDYCGKEYTWRVLDTEDDEDAWNRGEIDYLLIHPQSAGHGLNLQFSNAKNIVWFGLTANLEWYDQLNARLIGGHRRRAGITIHHIIADATMDVRMIALLSVKDATQRDLLSVLADLRREL